MPYDEFRRLLRRAGWQVGEFASVFGLGQRSLSNYGGEGKKLPQVWAIVAVLLYELMQRDVSKQTIVLKIGEMHPKPRPKKPRGKSSGLRRPADAAPPSASSAGSEGHR